jgi:aspartokinase
MIKIGGIKLSQELAQFNLIGDHSVHSSMTLYLKRITENRINLTYLAMQQTETGFLGSFCVVANDCPRVQQILATTETATCRIAVVSPVGAITIFPHKRNFALLGKVIHALTVAGIPIHAVSTSLSSLVINTDYRLLNRAIAELEAILDVPANHAPYQQELDVRAIE